MNRRDLLKLLTMGALGQVLDVDKLLWVPGEKKIFIMPSIRGLTTSEICAIEFERVLPRILASFERDNKFYSMLIDKRATVYGRK